MYSIFRRYGKSVAANTASTRNAILFQIDALESRRLLSGTSIHIPEPHGYIGSTSDLPSLAVARSNVYVADPGAAQVARISADGRVQLFQYKDTVIPVNLVGATDGGAWFIVEGSSQIGHISAAGKSAFFPVPTDFPGQYINEVSLVAGAAGSVWVASDATIGHIAANGDTTMQALTDFDAGYPQQFVADADGTAWVLTGGELGLGDYAPSEIGHLGANGTLAKIPLGNVTPSRIALGPSGNLYFSGVEQAQNDGGLNNIVGSITPAGQLTTAPVDFQATQMFTGRDGTVWIFSDQGTLVHISSGLDAQVTGQATLPESPIVTQASDGNFWFATADANQLGRLTPSGNLTEYSVPANSHFPAIESIDSDSAGNIWGLSGNTGLPPGVIVFHLQLKQSLLASAPATPIVPGPATEVATFAADGASASSFSATVKWPDGTSSRGTVQSSAGGLFSVTSAAGHAMAEGSATVTIRDRATGRTTRVTSPVMGNLPTPVGTPINIHVSVGQEFTLPVADFTNIRAGKPSQYSVAIDWGADNEFGFMAEKLKPDGHGGFLVLGEHLFANAGTFPITVELAPASNPGSNSNPVLVTATVTVTPETDPHRMTVAAPVPLSGLSGPAKLDLLGTADISKLVGAGADTATITGYVAARLGGNDVGTITFTNGQGSITLELLRKRAGSVFSVRNTWSYRLSAATGAYAGLKKISGTVDEAYGSVQTGYFFAFHV